MSSSSMICLLVLLSSCLLGASCFNLLCPPNVLSACFSKIQNLQTTNVNFCREAKSALKCAQSVVFRCMSTTGANIMDDLATYDVVGLFSRTNTLCP